MIGSSYALPHRLHVPNEAERKNNILVLSFIHAYIHNNAFERNECWNELDLGLPLGVLFTMMLFFRMLVHLAAWEGQCPALSKELNRIPGKGAKGVARSR